MCQFIHATMAPRGDEDSVRHLASVAHLNWNRIDESRIKKRLEPGETYFSTTRGMCDCGSVIGTACGHDASTADVMAGYRREAEKKRKQGWSEAKIERWLSQIGHSLERNEKEGERRLEDLRPETRRWIEFVSSVVDGGFAEWIGILHNGNSSDDFELRERRWLPLAQLTEDYLMNAEPHVLHAFVRRAPRE